MGVQDVEVMSSQHSSTQHPIKHNVRTAPNGCSGCRGKSSQHSSTQHQDVEVMSIKHNGARTAPNGCSGCRGTVFST